MMRTIRGLLALTALLGSVIAVPWLLLTWGRYPAPDDLTVDRLLLTPDDGRVLLWLVTGIGWVVWLLFTLSVGADLVGILGGRAVRLPGLRWMQLVSGTLLVAVLLMLGVGQRARPPSVGNDGLSGASQGVVVAVAYAAPPEPVAAQQPEPLLAEPPGGPNNVPERPTDGTESGALDATRSKPVVTDATAVLPETFEYRVQRGDDLWSLAETYLGDGLQWRRIRDLNQALLRHDPDHLEVGWVLTMPLPHPTPSGPPEQTLGAETSVPTAVEAPGRTSAVETADPAPVESPVVAAVPAPVATAEEVPSGPTETAPEETAPEEAASEEAASPLDPERERRLLLGGIGALTATAVVAGLAGRRRLQLVQRPVGQVPQRPEQGAERLRSVLAASQVSDDVDVVEWAVHMVARHALRTGTIGGIDRLRVGEAELEFVWDDRPTGLPWAAGSPGPAPEPFVDTGSSWVVSHAEVLADRRASVEEDVLRPWPALVTLGADDAGTYLIDLERWGRLSVQAETAERTGEILTSQVLDLIASPWSGGARVTVVGDDGGLVDVSGVDHVRHVDALDDIITCWETTAATQQSLVAVADTPVPLLRLDPDFAEAWSPQVLILLADITPAQRRRLNERFGRTHRGPIVLVSEHPGGEATLVVDEAPLRARFEPTGLDLSPQRVARQTRDDVIHLHRVTAPEALVPAPWAEEHPDVTPFTAPADIDTTVEEEPPMSDDPRLLLLGPIELEGARGEPPRRAPRQCLEYCAWLLEHPNASSVEMTRALLVAESTRRSNMSRLRGWLGHAADDRPYLPEAYSGRIRLHPAVRSDWQEVQLLLGQGIARTSSATLASILDMVRGAPLADAPPGDWAWAEELRIESACAIRDVAYELADRALEERKLDLAKWAVGRGLVAAPADELLLRQLLVAEHRSGNTREVERLVFTLNKQAHILGIDLLPETVATMQEVLEGRIRGRSASGSRRTAV